MDQASEVVSIVVTGAAVVAAGLSLDSLTVAGAIDR